MAFWIRSREKKLQETILKLEIQAENMAATLEAKKAQYQVEHDKIIQDVQRKALDQASLIQREHATKVEMMKLEKDKAINQAKADADKRVNATETKLNKEFYDKLSEGLAKLHSEGNAQTKFVEAAAMKLLDKAGSFNPKSTVAIEHKTIKADGNLNIGGDNGTDG